MTSNSAPACPSLPTALEDHVIILGLGHVGFRVCQILRRLGETVAVVGLRADPERVAEVEQSGCVFVAGDVRNPEILRRLGSSKAKALLALTDEELINLSVAIDTRQVNPNAKIIIRLFDQELAKHIRRVFAIQTVLSTSAIAAPLFTAAIFDDHNLACFQAHGASCAIVHWHIKAGSPLIGQPIGLFAEREACLPLLLQRDGGVVGDFQPEAHFYAGDRIIGMRTDGIAGKKAGLPFRRGNWLRAVREFFGQMPKVARVLLFTLALLLASGVPMFRFGLGLSWIDASYFAVTTLTTTGYGDINLLTAPDWLKAFGTLYMLGGAALLASLVGIVTDYLLSVRIRELLGTNAAPLQDHVILVGVGGLGVRIVEELQQRGSAVAVCYPGQPEDRHTNTVRASVRLVDGDPRSQEVLAQAGVANAQAILSITDDDMLNLSVCLLAKQMNPVIRTVVRVFDGYMAEKLKDHLNIDQVHSLSATAAPSFAAALYEHCLTIGFVWGDYLAWVSDSPGLAERGAPVGTIYCVSGIPLKGIAEDGLGGSLHIKLLPLSTAKSERT